MNVQGFILEIRTISSEGKMYHAADYCAENDSNH